MRCCSEWPSQEMVVAVEDCRSRYCSGQPLHRRNRWPSQWMAVMVYARLGTTIIYCNGHPLRHSCTVTVIYCDSHLLRQSSTATVIHCDGRLLWWCNGHPLWRVSTATANHCDGHPLRRSFTPTVIHCDGHLLRRLSTATVWQWQPNGSWAEICSLGPDYCRWQPLGWEIAMRIAALSQSGGGGWRWRNNGGGTSQ